MSEDANVAPQEPIVKGHWNWDVDDAAPSMKLEDITDPVKRARVEQALAVKREMRLKLQQAREAADS